MMESVNDIYRSARDGSSSNLEILLHSLESTAEERSKLIEHKTKDGDQITTPLIIAARNGHIECVEILLSFDADIEARGTVKFEEETIEGASALWAAAAKGEMDIVKLLINKGANVDARTKTNSTPLRAAAHDGRLDIVSYLVEHGADVNAKNNFEHTPLMAACYNGHRSVVNYLINKGAEIDAQGNDGNTALHFAVERGHLDIVKDLITKGTSQLPNKPGLTPLLSASNSCKIEIVEYFIARPDCGKLDEIHSLELLGATIANEGPKVYDIDKSYEYMMRGMKKRYEGDECVIKKDILPPIQAYQNRVECQTEGELKEIRNDPHAIQMEGLVVRERILGPNNTELCDPIVYRGAVSADSGDFEICITLWKHAMDITQHNDLVVGNHLERFAALFSQMIHSQVFPSFADVYDVLEQAVLEYDKVTQKIQKAKENKSIESLIDNLENVMHRSLYLLTILGHLNLTETDEQSLHQLLDKYLCMNPRTNKGKTLVHLAVSDATPVDEFPTKDVCKYPCYKTTKLLLETGAQVNAIDNEGNTPLHTLVMTKPKQGQQETAVDLDIVKDLITKGALQLCNKTGLTPLLSASNSCQIEIVEYFIDRPDCGKLDEIHSLELLGATIANKPKTYDIDKSYEYMMRGMKKRYEGNECVIKKDILPPIQAYQNRVECQTEGELKEIRNDPHDIHMEGLLMRERILGPHNTELCFSIGYRGAAFADSGRFEICIPLWKHAMDIAQQNDLAVEDYLKRLAGLFSQMIHSQVFLSFADVYNVLEHAVLEYDKVTQKIQKAKENESIELLGDYLENVMHRSLYLLTILEHLNLTPETDRQSLRQLLDKYLCMNPRTKQGKTLVHLAVSGATPVDESFTKDVCKYPCYKTTKLLLETGARVNAIDNEGNTPLHTVVMTKPKQGQQETVEDIITSLYDFNVHEDVTNAAGKTALEVSATEELREFLIHKRRIVLECLAARAIKHYQLRFIGLVPKSMELFISTH